MLFPGVHPSRVRWRWRGPPVSNTACRIVTADLDAARRRVQDFYARLGFNLVQVDVEPVPDKTAPRWLTWRSLSTEGPQQILREVATEGATRKRAKASWSRARCAFGRGEPVNLADWSQARKRLYDTNVFRQVDFEPLPLEPTPEDKAANIQPVRAVVRLIEYPVWRLRYGLQFNDEKVTDVRRRRRAAQSEPRRPRRHPQSESLRSRAHRRHRRSRTSAIAEARACFMSNASFFGLPVRSNGFMYDSRQRFRCRNGDVANRSPTSAA